MMGVSKENVKLAINDFKRVLEAIKNGISNGKEKEAAKSFRTRVRNGPNDIISNGFSTTLIYLLSKTENKNYKKIVEIINGRSTQVKIGDKFGYGAYLYLILYRLKEKGIIEGVDINKDPIEAINKIIDIEDYAYLIIRDYLIELKELTSACIDENGHINC